ncbi:hypothetical protein MH117_10525 [Paenibacillus sp. ACRRX]|uniref:hypothetical protein n=1 Tax=Paenibacillus sp. ACRRX TaxID=2918206 RepID=UPI001EF554B1|nr:hypothetical protein [Paenibacillus sp. ACRRX]MCG7407855.1 hypothetical protein [Paenibacillus sp. ACRRX]
MPAANKPFKIQYPTSNIQAVAVVILMIASLFNALPLLRTNYVAEVIWALAAWELVCLSYLGFVIHKMKSKPSSLSLQEDELWVEGVAYKASEIRDVIIMGRHKPSIGVKLIGKSFVPMNLCFNFTEGEQEGISAIRDWAERHQVKLRQSFFIKWI